jgi:hypothetical protein
MMRYALSVFALLVFCAAIAIGFSSNYQRNLEQSLDSALFEPELDPDALVALAQNIQHNANARSWNADAQDLAAQAAFAVAAQQRGKLQTTWLQASSNFSKRAVALRPMWAQSWLRLAWTEFQLDRNGAAWRQALSKVFRLRPRGLAVQLDLLRMRRSVDTLLSPEEQQEFAIQTALAFQDRPHEFGLALERYNRKYWLCELEASLLSYRALNARVEFCRSSG